MKTKDIITNKNNIIRLWKESSLLKKRNKYKPKKHTKIENTFICMMNMAKGYLKVGENLLIMKVNETETEDEETIIIRVRILE